MVCDAVSRSEEGTALRRHKSHNLCLFLPFRTVLGELTRKEEYFLKAWDLSGGKHTKAMRALGLMLLKEVWC